MKFLLRLIRRLICKIGFHRFDGKVGRYYPAPRCIDCGVWHHKDVFNASRWPK
jgi:hypothetical protein